jgi:hypothetical protein
MDTDLPTYNTEVDNAFDMLKCFIHDGNQFQVRIAGTVQDPLFNAADIGVVLGLGNVHSSLASLDDDMKDVLQISLH